MEGGDSAEARREYLRAQERMLLKHKNTSRWAKRAIKKVRPCNFKPVLKAPGLSA